MDTPSKLDKLFLHFFDTHFIADKGSAVETKPFQDEMRLATRLAVASAQTVYIPASSYFESPLCRQILGDLSELIPLGIIALSGSSVNLDEFLRERQDESFYRKDSAQHNWYRAQHDALSLPPYLRRRQSATRDVASHWDKSVSNETLARMLRDAAGCPIHELEHRLERVPRELGRLAFIPDHVYEILDLGKEISLVHARLRSVINEGYFGSYAKDLGAGVVVDLRYLACDFFMPSYDRNLSYARMVRYLRTRGRLEELTRCDQGRLLQLGDDPEWQQAIHSAVSYVGHGNLTGHAAGASVLCVAAAQVEFSVVTRRLTSEFGEGSTVYLDGRARYAMKFMDPENGTPWYVAGLPFQGQVDATHEIDRFNNALKPTLILMVGMCMGMPKRKLPVGTVVVPNEVVTFDHQRVTDEGTKYRPHGDRVDNGLYQLARILSSREFGYKVVADKALASASVKIENTNAEVVKTIEAAFPDAAAFDMEGWGFYRAGDGLQCLWVKAVADNAEAQSATFDGRADKHCVQSDATCNALDFAVALVREYLAAKPLDSI